MIKKKESAVKAGEGTNDLLGLLLQSNQDYIQEENSTLTKNSGLTIEEVIQESKQFYLAGQETTASLLTWAVIVLAMHQDWQHKARQEVIRVFGSNNIDYEAISCLNTVSLHYAHIILPFYLGPNLRVGEKGNCYMTLYLLYIRLI